MRNSRPAHLQVHYFASLIWHVIDTFQGYKPSVAKTADEYAALDAEDESLARWKASLGIVPGAAPAAGSGPKVRQQELNRVNCVDEDDPGFYSNSRTHVAYAPSWQEDCS